ncbi:MAG: type II toxin-antitoxin system HicB family antitoxin [Phycisphaeraceae bacterium]
MSDATTPSRPQQFTVSNGDLILTLTVAGDGYYAVESPMDPQLITQARSIEEAFEMAYDAIEGLRETRAQYRDAINKAMAASA